jgi:pimeloyl-ACP methyl ester carboxylesterase
MADAKSAPPPAKTRYRWRLALSRICLYLLLAYIAVGVILYFRQTGMIYVGSTSPLTPQFAQAQAKGAGLVPWTQTTTGATGPHVHDDFATHSAPRGTIVVFHGNGENAWDRPNYVEAMSRRGFRVFLYEYPGYGGRPGRPSEAVIVPDAREVIRSLDRAGDGPVYVWGVSLGSGVAAAVCHDPAVPVHGLALLMPWDTIANVAYSIYPYFPVSFMMTDRYDSVTNLEQFKHPICVVRGDQDDVVLPRLTLSLYAKLPEPKKMVVQTGYGHGDWPDNPTLSWWDEVLDFIAPK